MESYQKGLVSRNKFFFRFETNRKENNFYRRAKLFLSLIDDLKTTISIQNHKIRVEKGKHHYEITLYNPQLRYHRKVCLSEAELAFFIDRTKGLLQIPLTEHLPGT